MQMTKQGLNIQDCIPNFFVFYFAVTKKGNRVKIICKTALKRSTALCRFLWLTGGHEKLGLLNSIQTNLLTEPHKCTVSPGHYVATLTNKIVNITTK